MKHTRSKQARGRLLAFEQLEQRSLLTAGLLPVSPGAANMLDEPIGNLETDANLGVSVGSDVAPSATIGESDGGASVLTAIIDDATIQSNPTSSVEGFVDVFFDVPPGLEVYLAGYNAIVEVDPTGSGVTLTGAAEAEDAVFPGRIPQLYETGDRLLVQDNLPGVNEENLIVDGAGLFRIVFEVAAGVTGSFDLDLSFLYLVDGAGAQIPNVDMVGGMITVSAINLVVIVDDVTIASHPASTVEGFVDVYFDVPPGLEVYLAGYNAIVEVDPTGSGVALTGAAEAEDAVFPGRVPQLYETGDRLLVQDNLPGVNEENLIVDGAGLFRIVFEVAAGVTGSFDLDLSFLYLVDGAGAQIPNVDLVGGAITVVSTSVVDRHIFYNNSLWDGNNAGANEDDDNAIAPHPAISDPSEPAKELGKEALLPGQTATFANYTSYSKGINGIMIDISGLAVTPKLADFVFRVGNDNDPAGWATGPDPQSITVRPGAGSYSSDRVTLIWADNNWMTPTPEPGAIAKQWLQVTVLAANIGLAENDVFYFGNAVGESGDKFGDSNPHAYVNSTDEIGARLNPHSFGNEAEVFDAYDFNRDSYVNAADQIIVRLNPTDYGTALSLITVPPSPPSPAPPADENVLIAMVADRGLTASTKRLEAGRILPVPDESPTSGLELRTLPSTANLDDIALPFEVLRIGTEGRLSDDDDPVEEIVDGVFANFSRFAGEPEMSDALSGNPVRHD